MRLVDCPERKVVLYEGSLNWSVNIGPDRSGRRFQRGFVNCIDAAAGLVALLDRESGDLSVRRGQPAKGAQAMTELPSDKRGNTSQMHVTVHADMEAV